MEFKVAFIKEKLKLKENNDTIKQYNNYYWFRGEKLNNLKSKGVKVNDTLEDAGIFIRDNDGDGVYNYQYIIINTKTNNLYYRSYTKKDLLLELKKNFVINETNLNFEVDINSIIGISKFEVEIFNQAQQSLLDMNYEIDNISKLFTDDMPKSKKIGYTFSEDTVFKKDAIKSFNVLRNDRNCKVTMQGFDEYGNVINVAENVISTINIDIKYSGIVEEGNIPIKNIIDAIETLEQ